MENPSENERNPFRIGPGETNDPRIDTLVSQLMSSRHYLLNSVRGLAAEQLDAPVPGCPNTIGAILAHVGAAETMFRNITFHGRRFSEEEGELEEAFRFERNWLAGNDAEVYREHLWRSNGVTAELLRRKDDSWLDTANTFMGRPSNYHYYWTHLLLDEARHTGQIILIRKHLMPGHDPSFHPYAVD